MPGVAVVSQPDVGALQVRGAPDARGPGRAGYHRVEGMPEISRFFGIVIRMFYNDHAPPHFHATYGDREALIEIETLEGAPLE
jgi:hypothetical protein